MQSGVVGVFNCQLSLSERMNPNAGVAIADFNTIVALDRTNIPLITGNERESKNNENKERVDIHF